MSWPLSLVLASLFLALFLFGLRLGRHRRRTAVAGLLICLPIVILCWELRRWPNVGYLLARTGPWGDLYVCWGGVFAWVALGIACSAAVPRLARIAFVTIAAVNGLVTLWLLFAVHAWNLEAMDRKPGPDGLCRQSTGWTCGPAAAVTLLAHFGISATEGEMTRLSLTTPYVGVDDVELAMAIRRRALPAGYDVILARSDWQDLRSRKLPVIVAVWLPMGVYHDAVALSADEEHVTMADPLGGIYPLSRDQFLAGWQKTLIALEPAPTAGKPAAAAGKATAK